MSKSRQVWNDIALLLGRVSIGLYMLLAGVGKVSGEINNGFGSFYRGPFSGLQPGWLPDFLAAPYGYALPWLEVLVGVLLVAGFVTRWAAAGAGLMIVSFTIALALVMGPTAQAADASGPFKANYIFIALCLILAVWGGGRASVDAWLPGRRRGA